MSITIADIAAKAKVSRMTVSRVISGNGYVAKKTADRIKEIMKKHNYQPNLIARSLSSKRTQIIGVVIPKTKKLFLDNYIAQVVSGVNDGALEKDYKIMLVPTDQNIIKKQSYLELINGKLFDGLILLKTKIDDKYLDELVNSGFPSIIVNHRKNRDGFNYVDADNINGTRKALEYLYEKGHKQIAFVTGSLNETNAKDRLTGYKTFLKEKGIKFDNKYVINGNFDKQTAYKETTKLLALKDKPTAIFCSDDYMAIGVIEQLRENGIPVPEGIAVIGFDNIEIGEHYTPALTTVKQPMYDIGKTAFEALWKMINKEQDKPLRIMLKTELILRDSA